MKPVRQLLGRWQQLVDDQNNQSRQLKAYLKANHNRLQVAISQDQNQVILTTDQAASASRLNLDWANLKRYCPQTRLIIRVDPGLKPN